jgi:hypothetical protein
MTDDFKTRRNQRIKELYRSMKARHPDLHEAAVRLADAAKMRHDLSLEAAASIEVDAMMLAARAVGHD